MSARLVDTIDVINLRSHGVHPTRDPHSLPKWTATSVTLVRLPIAIAGIAGIAAHRPLVASLMFVLFAAIDYLDGVVARSGDNDDASRRALDVVVDRVAIHGASLTCVLVYGANPELAYALLARDVVQGLYSGHAALFRGVVFVGPKWHMLYGLCFLAWGIHLIIEGSAGLLLTLALGAVSLATLGDFVRLTRRAIRERSRELL